MPRADLGQLKLDQQKPSLGQTPVTSRWLSLNYYQYKVINFKFKNCFNS